jgi:hypothetical protein
VYLLNVSTKLTVSEVSNSQTSDGLEGTPGYNTASQRSRNMALRWHHAGRANDLKTPFVS